MPISCKYRAICTFGPEPSCLFAGRHAFTGHRALLHGPLLVETGRFIARHIGGGRRARGISQAGPQRARRARTPVTGSRQSVGVAVLIELRNRSIHRPQHVGPDDGPMPWGLSKKAQRYSVGIHYVRLIRTSDLPVFAVSPRQNRKKWPMCRSLTLAILAFGR